MTIRQAANTLTNELTPLYSESEAANIADLVMEHVTGLTRSERITKDQPLSKEANTRLIQIKEELLTHKPVQYVLGDAWFMGMKFFVDESVLIPRPETEELVDLILQSENVNRVIDIGTGSGCIAVAIKKKLPSSDVYAVDVSESSLAVARKNAEHNKVSINFHHLDILDESQWSKLPSFDVIVSNPPYIPFSEKDLLHQNVTGFEPHTALFVPDTDPLLFYKQIVRFSERQRTPCTLYFEIHENYGDELNKLFVHYNPQVKRDMQGKDRMLVLSVK